MLPYLSQARFSLAVHYLEPGGVEPAGLAPGALLNHVAEPDSCSETLGMVERIVAKAGRPCFNHPNAIGGTTRDEVSRVLSGIEGLKVPKTIRVRERTGTEHAQRNRARRPCVSGADQGCRIPSRHVPDESRHAGSDRSSLRRPGAGRPVIALCHGILRLRERRWPLPEIPHRRGRRRDIPAASVYRRVLADPSCTDHSRNRA